MQSMLGLLLHLREMQGRPVVLAPKSIHQVVDDILVEALSQLHTPGMTIYVEPEYDLPQVAVMFILSELSNKLDPAIRTKAFLQYENKAHVLFQFKN
jgi:hypothetical protein